MGEGEEEEVGGGQEKQCKEDREDASPGPAVKIKLTPSEVVGWGGSQQQQQGASGLPVGKSFQVDSTRQFGHQGFWTMTLRTDTSRLLTNDSVNI